jgi:hypothetical protein
LLLFDFLSEVTSSAAIKQTVSDENEKTKITEGRLTWVNEADERPTGQYMEAGILRKAFLSWLFGAFKDQLGPPAPVVGALSTDVNNLIGKVRKVSL